MGPKRTRVWGRGDARDASGGLPDHTDKSILLICHPCRMSRATEKTDSLELIAAPAIEKRIFSVRGRQVMLDEDLADLYGVETKRLIQQVKRNLKRFPEDFMFQMDKAEAEALRSQIATSTMAGVGAVTPRMSSPSRASPCSPASSEAIGLSP